MKWLQNSTFGPLHVSNYIFPFVEVFVAVVSDCRVKGMLNVM